jgi:hypothetical protein
MATLPKAESPMNGNTNTHLNGNTPSDFNHTRTSPSPPSADLPDLDHDSAKALLSNPDPALLNVRFYLRDNTDSGAAFWHVECINNSPWKFSCV